MFDDYARKNVCMMIKINNFPTTKIHEKLQVLLWNWNIFMKINILDKCT